jgi:glycine/serine hydroxymethyltransferase
MKEPEMATISAMIVQVLNHPNDRDILQQVRESVLDLCDRFPLDLD